MKNINLIPIILIAFMTLVFSSCQKDEEVFSKSQNVTAEDKPENNRNSANNHNVNIYEEYIMSDCMHSKWACYLLDMCLCVFMSLLSTILYSFLKERRCL